MIQLEPIGWWNTGFPTVLLGGLGVFLPWLITPKNTRSHRTVSMSILASGIFLLIAGALVFAVVYSARIDGIWGTFTAAPLATFGYFLKLSVYAAMLWVPILALVWFGLAQGVEKRRGEDAAQKDDAA